MTAEEPPVLVERDGPVVIVTLNRPGRRNAITQQMDHDLQGGLQSAAADPTCRAVILTGAGTAFCSGGEMGDRSGDTLSSVTPLSGERRLRNSAAIVEQIAGLPLPVIAAVNGPAMGAGCNLALICDLVVAGESATFGQRHVARGMTTDLGGTWILPRLLGLHRAKEFALLGDLVLSAKEAEAMGLVNRVVPDSMLLEEALATARRIAKGGPVGIRFAKENINQSFGRTLSEALDAECRSQALCFTSDDAREGITAFLEKREPEFKGE